MSFKKGVHFTEEHRDNISEAMKGHIVSSGTRQKLSEFHKTIPREEHGSWKGGIRHKDGYLFFKVPEGCRFSCMKDHHGYVPLHRLVMAAHLDRPLKSKEIVHHINEIRDDNRIENLMLIKNSGEHINLHLKNLKKEMILI